MLRVRAIAELPRGGGAEYAAGLRTAVSAALEWGLAGIEHGEEAAPSIPDPLLAQARLAVRSGVSLDIVLRRYSAGRALLDDFLIEEAERLDSVDSGDLKRLLRSQAAMTDHLLAAVSNAFLEEGERRPMSSERRTGKRIERLLSGEPLEIWDLGYELESNHLGLVAEGSESKAVIEALAGDFDAILFSVPRETNSVWAWLGSRQKLDSGALKRRAKRHLSAGVVLGIGEPGAGLAGWRLTHSQAVAAHLVALRGEEPVARYADVALLASAIQDELLSQSLRRLYLEPLVDGPDKGAVLFETLSAYFAASRSVSSAAAALGVTRQTVTNRLRGVEERIGRPLDACGGEMEAALGLRSIGSS